jgi:tRNA pseudouridine38-40 synthase
VEEIDILITGDSFLQRMVRNIVGLLVQVGLGKNSVESVQNILAKKDRNAVIISPAPAHGLYLLDVHYDKERRKVKEQRIVERYQYSSPQ